MLSLCDVMAVFYPKEILKIENRLHYFEKVRMYWMNK